MAIKSGRCANCGSIIRVDDQQSYGVCPFCRAKTPVDTALAIEQNPSAYTFPNEEQPELTEEDEKLALVGYHRTTNQNLKKAQQQVEAAAARAQKKKTPSAAERVAALQSKPIEVPKLKFKQILSLVFGTLLIFGLLAGITLNLYFSRTEKRLALNQHIHEILPFDPVKNTDGFAFSGQSNQHLMAVSPNALNPTTAQQVYDAFKKARADVYGLSPDDAQSNVTVRLYGKEGGYVVNQSGVSAIEAQKDVPTHSSTPDASAAKTS